jgi:2-C-methyl-D-erythritol 4-phosphate cytidylyltransferase
MHKSVIIVAGGSGKRMGSVIPKQFLELNGKPVLMWTIEKFYAYDPKISIILVLPLDQVSYWDRLCIQHKFKIKHEVAFGGESRFHSVKSGFKLVEKGSCTGIHDGVRPLVSSKTIDRCFREAEKYGNAIPFVNLNESVRRLKNNKSKALNRELIKIIQTPQVFSYEQLENAYNQEYKDSFSDDATIVEKLGYQINLLEGNIENIKLTTPFDMKMAEMYLDKK